MAKKKTQSEVIDEFVAVHGDRYDYSKVVYVDSRTPVRIMCHVHGEFEQIAGDHVKRNGCKKCSFDASGKETRRKNKEKFIDKCMLVHGHR